MEWQKVTGETVLNHMAVELANAYDKWIVAYPQKVGRLDEITASVRAEWRHTIASVPKNSLNPDEETLPDAVVRHVENVIQYEMGMEMGVTLTADGRRLIDQAEIYRRQIGYGHYKFYDDTNPQANTPSYVVPGKSAGRALGDLVALLLGVFFWCLPARAAWIQEKNETTYVPVHYDITEQSLGGHLAGIDQALGVLADTNSLYSIVSVLPSQIAALNDKIFDNPYYELNGAIHPLNVQRPGLYRQDRRIGLAHQYSIHLNALQESLFLEGFTIDLNPFVDLENDVIGCVVVGGDLCLDYGITLGGVRIDSWDDVGGGGGGGGGGLSTARVTATNTSVVAGDYLIWLDTRAFTSSQSVTLTLPDMDGDAQTIVVRRLGNEGSAYYVRGTNTFELTYDGDGITADWLKAATNWFWRSF